jgi:hypothetical protein
MSLHVQIGKSAQAVNMWTLIKRSRLVNPTSVCVCCVCVCACVRVCVYVCVVCVCVCVCARLCVFLCDSAVNYTYMQGEHMRQRMLLQCVCCCNVHKHVCTIKLYCHIA